MCHFGHLHTMNFEYTAFRRTAVGWISEQAEHQGSKGRSRAAFLLISWKTALDFLISGLYI